ncbi:hypothetical protein [Stutzerimonas tarimensis]|uniref:DUF2513 domain-containing protein n=1 Tax=Stutzerimonas tarimensis TaxID=1507735 RepID=A0ABV7TB77_9GAMM
MDLQIDDFYKDAAKGLLTLYQAFPRKVPLYVEDLIGLEEPDEFGLPSKRHQGCLSALVWLADEGYIRYDTRLQFLALDQAVLTEKGFLRMTCPIMEDPNLPPSVGRVQGSLAHQLREGMRLGDSERIARLARLIFEPPPRAPWHATCDTA